jgi:hypothetical protein
MSEMVKVTNNGQIIITNTEDWATRRPDIPQGRRRRISIYYGKYSHAYLENNIVIKEKYLYKLLTVSTDFIQVTGTCGSVKCFTLKKCITTTSGPHCVLMGKLHFSYLLIASLLFSF